MIWFVQGPTGLYKGFGAGLAVYGPFVGIYFVVYEQWKKSVGRLINMKGFFLLFDLCFCIVFFFFFLKFFIVLKDAELPMPVHLSGGAVTFTTSLIRIVVNMYLHLHCM